MRYFVKLALATLTVVTIFSCIQNEIKRKGVMGVIKNFDNSNHLDTTLCHLKMKTYEILYFREDSLVEMAGRSIRIKLFDKINGIEREGVTDSGGIYQVYLKPGIYNVKLEKQRVNGMTLKNFKMESGVNYEIDLELGFKGAESNEREIEMNLEQIKYQLNQFMKPY